MMVKFLVHAYAREVVLSLQFTRRLEDGVAFPLLVAAASWRIAPSGLPPGPAVGVGGAVCSGGADRGLSRVGQSRLGGH